MSKKYVFFSYILLIISLSICSTVTLAQAIKRTNTLAKIMPTKGLTKGTLTADMDCAVKLNGAAKTINLKAYTPLAVALKIGFNDVEATSADKKALFKKSIEVKMELTPRIKISFFDDSNFLEYIKTGNTTMAEMAIGKNPGLVTNENATLAASPLQIAIENSQPDMVIFLLSKGASFKEPENIYPLHLAIQYASSAKSGKDKSPSDETLVSLFLNKGCKITDVDDGGNTPLHCAVRVGKMDMVELLVKKGADVNAKNDFDDTPLKIAEDKGLISIINFLVASGSMDTKKITAQ